MRQVWRPPRRPSFNAPLSIIDADGTHSDGTATSAATCDETLGNCSSGRAIVRKLEAWTTTGRSSTTG